MVMIMRVSFLTIRWSRKTIWGDSIMKLRKLEQRDAVLMLEWMHDCSVVDKMNTDFASKTLDDCMDFIKHSMCGNNIHMAIVNDEDVYMGTVSLKSITARSAEFAITVRREAMGKGYAIWAMKEIMRIGYEQYGVKEIYWCVAEDNVRALRFYDKNNFPRVSYKKICMVGQYSQEQMESYVWYQVVRTM